MTVKMESVTLASVLVSLHEGDGELRFIDCPLDAKHYGRQFKCHLVLTRILWENYYYYHFTGEKIET